MAKYKCNDCGHQFKEKGFVEECPQCESDNIMKQSSSPITLVKRYWFIPVAFFVFLVMILIDWEDIVDKPETKVYQVKFSSFDAGIKINIYEWDTTKTAKFTILEFAKAEKVIKAYNFEVEDNLGRQVTVKDGNIYPCTGDNNLDTLIVKWHNSTKYPLSNRSNNKKVLYFELKVDKPHPSANCMKPSEPLAIESVTAEDNCKINVKTNKDSVANRDVMISITGKNGPYENKRIWDAKDYDTIKVWSYIKGKSDTVEYQGNGNILKPIGCDNMGPEEIEELRRQLRNYGKTYGGEPDNTSYRNRLNDLIIGSPDFYIDGEFIGEWADFTTKVSVRHLNNNDKFTVALNGVKLDQNNGRVLEMRFKTVN